MHTPAGFAAPLLDAYARRHATALSPSDGPADAAQAYAVQREIWRALAGDVRPDAWKVGAASRDTEPTAAAVLPQRRADSPARFDARDFIGLGIEAEIAVRFGRDLPARAEPYAETEIRAAIGSLHVAMELVDTRLADADAAGPFWRLADSLLNGGLVIGDAVPRWRDLDFSMRVVRVRAHGRVLAETTARPPLDDLFHCLPWWLARNGGARAGDIVTTGAWNGMHPVGLPAEAEVEFVGLGKARVRVA